MIKQAALAFCLVVSAGVGGLRAQTPVAQHGKLLIETYLFRTYDGRQHSAELGRLWVPEVRQGTSSRLIQLSFVRLKSTAAKPSFPIVFLAGGPGIPGIGLGQVPVYFSLFERLREVADVILLDQRGTGLSSPNLQCPPSTLPVNAFETQDKTLAAFKQSVRTCAEHWRAQGVDLRGYNSNSSADDLEELRRALGAERLNLLAWSYGTELALATIRRHGPKLERVVLVSTRGPNNLLKLPSVWDLQIRKLSQLAREDDRINKFIPDMETLIKRVFANLERQPATITIHDKRDNRQISLNVGKVGLQTLIRVDLSDARAFAALPALIYTIDSGDYSILSRRMEQLYNGFGLSAMGMAVDCSAGWSPSRLALVNREAKTALMSNVNLQWSPDVCKLMGNVDLGSVFRSPIRSKVRTLFVSGTLDPNAPPFQAEEISRGFSNATHLVVENAGHESLPAEAIQTLAVDFFKGHDVSGRAIRFPAPRFLTLDEAKSNASVRP